MTATPDTQLDADLARALHAATTEIRAAARRPHRGPNILGRSATIARLHRAEEQLAWLLGTWREVPADLRSDLALALSDLRALLVDLHGSAHSTADLADRTDTLLAKLRVPRSFRGIVGKSGSDYP